MLHFAPRRRLYAKGALGFFEVGEPRDGRRARGVPSCAARHGGAHAAAGRAQQPRLRRLAVGDRHQARHPALGLYAGASGITTHYTSTRTMRARAWRDVRAWHRRRDPAIGA